MTVILTTRAEINLDTTYRVAWRKEAVRISEPALQRIAACRASFLRLIDSDPAPVIYGVTTAMGEFASPRLESEERDRHARIKAFAAATSFGDPLPDRVVRAIVLARLANFLEGNAATTPRMALAVAAMLDGRPMPIVPSPARAAPGKSSRSIRCSPSSRAIRARGEGARIADQRVALRGRHAGRRGLAAGAAR